MDNSNNFNKIEIIKQMIKKTMLIGMMCVSFFGISQTQCNELTKDSVQCNNTTKAKNSLLCKKNGTTEY